MNFYVLRQNQRVLLSLVQDFKNYVGHTTISIPTSTINSKNVPFSPSQFESNPHFHTILNDIISKNIYDSQIQQSFATHLQNGYLNINDQRTPLNWGRTADPEDIIGTVLVKDGKMVRNTFEAMPTHRLYTIHGFFQLEPMFLEKLISKLKTAT